GLEQARIMLLEVLSIRFGAVSRELTGRIEQIADHKVLRELHRAALRCADVGELRRGLKRQAERRILIRSVMSER
ncbi:MAG: hypothetical protein D3916_07775, partial [Candidatus Electrothrix sp. MAN1_4]|nr:hypothetical protein [Candidatus Electrothrix sp. MAN1_4]